MIHLRLIVPAGLTGRVLQLLTEAPEVTNLWHLPNAGRKPHGDLISCDVAKEAGSTIVRELQDLGLHERGSISVENVDASVSRGAEEAERSAPGAPSDAVVWEEVEDRISESATLSVSFLLFMVLATTIAAVGVITDSIVLIIGAMVVGPEYGPLAGICVALITGRPHLAGVSLRALLVGFPVAMMAAAALTIILTAVGVAPDVLDPETHELTLFISRPNWYSVIVAGLAGIAGMLALISAKSGALVGVLISVTTIPAAANVGVAAAYRSWGEAVGAAVHLSINVVAIILTGLAVLGVAEWARRRRHSARTRGSGPRP